MRHARAQHAAQSAKQPSDLCFLLQASINELRIPARSFVCRLRLGRAQLPAECLRSRRPARRVILRCGRCIQRALATRHKLTSCCRDGRKHHPSPARPASSCQPPLWPCAYTARIASRSQSPGASSLALLADAGGAQVVAQHAAKACLKPSNHRGSTIPRTPRWSCRGVLMGSTCAEQAQCAEVKVRTLSPIPPQCIAACRLTLRRTSWRLPASSISISILLVRRFGVGSRAHTR